MREMVQRVAVALYRQHPAFGSVWHGRDFSDLPLETREAFTNDAMAALMAVASMSPKIIDELVERDKATGTP